MLRSFPEAGGHTQSSSVVVNTWNFDLWILKVVALIECSFNMKTSPQIYKLCIKKESDLDHKCW